MYRDIKSVKPLSDYRIYVEIEDGRKGIFDLKPYLDYGVFRKLRDVQYFNRIDILFGAVTWPNEQDIAPEILTWGRLLTYPAGLYNLRSSAKVPPLDLTWRGFPPPRDTIRQPLAGHLRDPKDSDR